MIGKGDEAKARIKPARRRLRREFLDRASHRWKLRAHARRHIEHEHHIDWRTERAIRRPLHIGPPQFPQKRPNRRPERRPGAGPQRLSPPEKIARKLEHSAWQHKTLAET